MWSLPCGRIQAVERLCIIACLTHLGQINQLTLYNYQHTTGLYIKLQIDLLLSYLAIISAHLEVAKPPAFVPAASPLGDIIMHVVRDGTHVILHSGL